MAGRSHCELDLLVVGSPHSLYLVEVICGKVSEVQILGHCVLDEQVVMIFEMGHSSRLWERVTGVASYHLHMVFWEILISIGMCEYRVEESMAASAVI